MKRETKVGMTVAGTFLALAGGGLGIRMWRGDAEAPATPPASAEVAQVPPKTPTPEPSNTPVAPPPNALVNAMQEPVFPAVQPTTTVVSPPPPVPTESQSPTLNASTTPTPVPVPVPVPVNPAPVVPEPAFPPVVETPKPSESQPPPPLGNDSPKQADATPTPPNPAAEEPKNDPTPLPPFQPVVEAKPDVPVTAPTAIVAAVPAAIPEPVAKIETPQRPEGGSPAPLPDAIKSVQSTGVVAKPTRPATDSYMEEEHKLKAGDNFNGVSKKFYYNEKYAQALQQYNRDYPLASANIKADPPRLNPGQVVWVPPIRVLEKRYPNLIPDFKPLPGQSTSESPKAAADTPNWTSANSNTPAQPVSANNTGPKTYRVRDGGETMHEIARRTMGNTLAWQEVYRLNPSLNPSATTPIPAGTLLRLPATAKE